MSNSDFKPMRSKLSLASLQGLTSKVTTGASAIDKLLLSDADKDDMTAFEPLPRKRSITMRFSPDTIKRVSLVSNQEMLHDDLQHTSTLREDTILDRAHGVSNLDDLLGVGGEFCCG